MVVGHPAGGDGSDIEGTREDESEGQRPEEVAGLMETIRQEMEEPSKPESEKAQRKKRRKDVLFGVRPQKSVCLILQHQRKMMQGLDIALLSSSQVKMGHLH